jgi:pimeloyl-ACP methyl ester carboxylesterase
MTTLVTIPGIMSDARTWGAVAEAMKLQGARVHVADTRHDTTIEAMAARSLTDTDGELIVLAHSMGGRVALEMGRQAPDRIRAMVLANTNAEGLGEHELAHREARIAEGRYDCLCAWLGTESHLRRKQAEAGSGCQNFEDSRGLPARGSRASEPRFNRTARRDTVLSRAVLSGAATDRFRGPLIIPRFKRGNRQPNERCRGSSHRQRSPPIAPRTAARTECNYSPLVCP